MTNFNEQMNTLLYKNISLTLYSRKGDISCVWEVSWRRGQTAILTPSSSSTIAAFLSHLGWVAQPWVTEGSKPSVCKLVLMLASSLQLTWIVWHLVILLFNAHLLPLFFCLFTQVHLLINGSVEGQYITIVVLMSTVRCFIIFLFLNIKEPFSITNPVHRAYDRLTIPHRRGKTHPTKEESWVWH